MSAAELLWELSGPIAESPVWDDQANCIYFRSQRVLAPGESGAQIHRYGISDGSQTTFELPERVGSIGICTSGRLVVALDRRIVRFDPETEEIIAITGELEEPKGNQFNDGKVGPDGCFWVGTSDVRRHDGLRSNGNGWLYRVSPDGSIAPKTQGTVCSNGLAWTPDGKAMFHSDSFNGVLDVWDFDASDGQISNKRRLGVFSIEEGYPDGAACDADGFYWSAGVTAGRFNKFTTSGELLDTLDVPCPAPTMPCFVGDTLYFTSLARHMSPDAYPIAPEKAPNDVTGLFRMPAPAAGAVIERFPDQ